MKTEVLYIMLRFWQGIKLGLILAAPWLSNSRLLPQPWRAIVMSSALLLVIIASGQAHGQEAPAERVAQAQVQEAPVPVSVNLAGAFLEGSNIHDLGLLSAEQIAAADRAAAENFAEVNPRPPRVGVVRSTGAVPLSIEQGFTLRTQLQKGNRLWTMAIRSPEAFGIRLHFSNFEVGEGSVIIYSQGESGLISHGPYTGKGPNGTGEFWTASLPGSTAFIEVSGTDAPKLQVSEILHFDKHPAGVSEREEKKTGSLPLPCQLDAMCFGSSSVHPFARDAVGQMNFVDGGMGYVCTGTILNDLDNETFVPYFITAFHCISTQSVTNTLEVVWLWQRSSCGGTLPSYFSLPRSNGGTLLATNPTTGGNDMSFIRLNGEVLGGTLAGWTAAALPSSFAGIHHPGGDWKRGTIMHAELIVGCSSLPTSQYHYCEQDSGITEGGSSGSGIFDSGGRLMGQLFGVCCPASHGDNCVNSDCTNRNQYNNVYGRFDVTYPLIQRWLEIGGTIHVDRAYSGVELGTPTQPFNTVTEAVNFAWNGARVNIRAGSYPENVTTSKTLTFLSNGGLVAIGVP